MKAKIVFVLLLLFMLAVLLSSSGVWGDVAFDNGTASCSGWAGYYSFSHTCTGSDLYLLVDVVVSRNDRSIDSVKYDLDDELRSRINDRIGSLDEFMKGLTEGHVAVSWEGGSHEQTRVSAEVWGGGHKFEASDTDWKPGIAIDKTRKKLESQITREHSKELKSRDRDPRK